MVQNRLPGRFFKNPDVCKNQRIIFAAVRTSGGIFRRVQAAYGLITEAVQEVQQKEKEVNTRLQEVSFCSFGSTKSGTLRRAGGWRRVGKAGRPDECEREGKVTEDGGIQTQ